jgi:hypothetical protein
MNTLEAAINAKGAATSALTTAFTGNLRGDGTTWAVFWDMAAEGAVQPYLVIQQLAAPMTSKYGGVLFSEPIYRFKSVAVGRAMAIANIEKVMTAFDEAILTLTSGRVNNVTRLGDPVTTMYLPQNSAGATEFESVVDYQYSIS